MGGVGSGRRPGQTTAWYQRYACSTCGANAGQPCRSQRTGKAGDIHAARKARSGEPR